MAEYGETNDTVAAPSIVCPSGGVTFITTESDNVPPSSLITYVCPFVNALALGKVMVTVEDIDTPK